MSEPIVIFSTASSPEEARLIARTLVEERLAACVNIGKTVESVYTWKGELCEEAEIPLMIKSEKAAFDVLSMRLKELHSYEVPEIIALPIVAGNEDYLNWIKENVQM